MTQMNQSACHQLILYVLSCV